jgi:hypothetical protein
MSVILTDQIFKSVKNRDFLNVIGGICDNYSLILQLVF